MKYVTGLLKKELMSIDYRLDCKRQSLTALSTQINDLIVEIRQIEQVRDELSCELIKYKEAEVVEDIDDDLPTRLEGSD